MMQSDEQKLSQLIRTQATRHRAPASLQAAIRASLPADAPSPTSASAAPHRHPWSWSWLPSLGAFAAGVMATLLIAPHWFASPAPSLSEALVDSHVRSLQASHLTDVLSTDQHTVKPWFAGKLDYTPTVRDFATAGFPLAGGRLDVVAGHPVAALVYRHRLHLINVFVMPRDPTDHIDAAVRATTTQRGFNVVHWAQGSMSFWAVSDLNSRELSEFANLEREAAD